MKMIDYSKVLFVDIDGVLAIGDFIEDCFQQLKRIQDETRCKIVLISTYRKSEWERDLTKAEFNRYGIQWEKKDRTCQLPKPTGMNERPLEISYYIQQHPEIRNFAIVDDENHRTFGRHMFHCYPTDDWAKNIDTVGLRKPIADKVIAFLNEGIEKQSYEHGEYKNWEVTIEVILENGSLFKTYEISSPTYVRAVELGFIRAHNEYDLPEY